jgi:1,4-alpha-glucan branching enzyme
MRARQFTPACEPMESRQLLSVALPDHTASALKSAATAFHAQAISSTQVALSWNSTKGATGYIDQELVTTTKTVTVHGHSTSHLDTTWATLGKLGKSDHSVTVNGFQPDSAYTFQLITLKGQTRLKSAPQTVHTPTSSAGTTTGDEVGLLGGLTDGSGGQLGIAP